MDKDIINIIPNFLLDSEINYLLNIDKTKFKRSGVGSYVINGMESSSISARRTSSTAGISRRENTIITNIENRIAFMFDTYVDYIEPFQIERFEHDQFFKPSYHTKPADANNILMVVCVFIQLLFF